MQYWLKQSTVLTHLNVLDLKYNQSALSIPQLFGALVQVHMKNPVSADFYQTQKDKLGLVYHPCHFNLLPR